MNHNSPHDRQDRPQLLQLFIGHCKVILIENHDITVSGNLQRAEEIFIGRAQKPLISTGVQLQYFLSTNLLACIDEFSLGILPRCRIVRLHMDSVL